jgi:hypothetical protein
MHTKVSRQCFLCFFVSTPVIVHGDFNAAALKNAYRVVMRVLFISGELIAGDLPYRLSE